MNEVNNPAPGLSPETGGPAKGSLVSADENPERKYEKAERILLLVALAIGILFDRLIADQLSWDVRTFLRCSAAFWLSYLALFYAFNWSRIKRDKLLWAVAAFVVLLCVWNFIFISGAYESGEYAMLNWLVIPAVLMAHAQIFAQGIGLKQVFRVVVLWLAGFFVKPFSAIGRFFGAAASCVRSERRPAAKSAALALVISALLLAVIVPMLMRADMVFGYYINSAVESIDAAEIILHTCIAVFAMLLFYSFFWNARYGNKWRPEKRAETVFNAIKLEYTASCIVISAVVLVYALFCAVQFTYLFARAGLPAGMTYSEYAREGFSQIVAICIINLLIYGYFIFTGRKGKVMTGLLTALLAMTAIILVSGFVRLGLYIDAYGMTWLRLLSAWFIVYLAAAIVLCAIRLFKEKLPLAAVCALVLLAWFTVLGYSNPDRLIDRYNEANGYDSVIEYRNVQDYSPALSI